MASFPHFPPWESVATAGRSLATSAFQHVDGGMVKHWRKYHGMNRSPEHIAWKKMKSRCYNPKDKRYARYGGRGIRVAEEWVHDFPAFLAHIGPRPSPKHSIDRADNEGHYEPGNVRWATMTTQQRNRSSNRILEAFGERRTAAEWAERIGLSTQHVISRLAYGWSVEDAVTYPVGTKNPRTRAGVGKASGQTLG